MSVRQDKYGRNGNIGMACLATKEQAKLAIKMLNKTKQYVANQYKHQQTDKLNNNTKEKDKRYKKPVEKKQLQETKTCYACGSKENLIKSCKKNTNLFVTNKEWPDISDEELKYCLEEYGKVNSIKTQRNRNLGRNESLNGQLPITRNENRKRKDTNENRENTKNKINKKVEQSNEITKKKTRQSKKAKKYINKFQSILSKYQRIKIKSRFHNGNNQ